MKISSSNLVQALTLLEYLEKSCAPKKIVKIAQNFVEYHREAKQIFWQSDSVEVNKNSRELLSCYQEMESNLEDMAWLSLVDVDSFDAGMEFIEKMKSLTSKNIEKSTL